MSTRRRRSYEIAFPSYCFEWTSACVFSKLRSFDLFCSVIQQSVKIESGVL